MVMVAGWGLNAVKDAILSRQLVGWFSTCTVEEE